MKKISLLAVAALALGVSGAFAQDAQTETPAVALPDAIAPTQEATDFVFLAPIIGGVLGVAALAGAGGGGGQATVSTTN